MQTRLSGLFVAVLLVATMLFLTPLFDGLPQATLAAIIIAAVDRPRRRGAVSGGCGGSTRATRSSRSSASPPSPCSASCRES